MISAPSGAGKTTIIHEIFKQMPELRFSVSATTRKLRNGEVNGEDYYFISHDEFEKKIDNNEFIEWENVHGELYGTLKKEIESSINNSVNTILDVDVKGALSIKKLYPDAVTIFIDAPKKEIEQRLKGRKTESEEQLNKRIQRMEWELGEKDKFDNVVLNKTNPGGIKIAAEKIIKIIKNKS
ncbi:MAG: guanylate kinase [Ignavibacteriae bacterium]|nr:MAG: guanylate kinase [Ignavibacteriota bacterium]